MFSICLQGESKSELIMILFLKTPGLIFWDGGIVGLDGIFVVSQY